MTTDAARIDAIHRATACYTCRHEIEPLLDAVGWPGRPGILLDPACGSGNVLTAALERLETVRDDVDAIVARLAGVEMHEGAAREARRRTSDALVATGWTPARARVAASRIVRHADFLLDDLDVPPASVIVANPPYLRAVRLDAAYREAIGAVVPRHAAGDLLHAFLHRMSRHLTHDGVMALITSDRWLGNAGTASLRAEVGARFAISGLRRLDAASAFHRPKDRTRGTPPRVHAVAMTLGPEGRRPTRDPFAIEDAPIVDGVALADLLEVRLAPYLGPHGRFVVDAGSGLPAAHLVPCVEPRDIDTETGRLGPTRRWAVLTGDEEPPREIIEHLDRNGAADTRRRGVRWLPPERFDRHLPLSRDAVLVPRIARGLRAVRLPAGRLPTGHSLVVTSGADPSLIRRVLEDERVRAQADALAPRIEDGYRSYTATLLRRLVVPHDLAQEIARSGEGETTSPTSVPPA